jgi:hypothetical protein
MNKTVFYTPGAFGNYFKHLLNSYEKKKLIKGEFMPSGNSHFNGLQHDDAYPINLDKAYEIFKQRDDGYGLVWDQQYFFMMLHSTYSRTNPGSFGECGVEYLQNNFYDFYTSQKSYKVSNYWDLMLQDIENFYNFKCNKDNPKVPRIVLRQLFFFYITNEKQNTVTIRNNEILQSNLKLVSVDTILDYGKLHKLMNSLFGYDLDFAERHRKFIEKNNSLKAFNLKNKIVDTVINKKANIKINCDVLTEAGILYDLEKYFYDIPFYNIPVFFSDTDSIIQYIKSFPNYMKAPNKLFSTKHYKTISRNEHDWF